MLKLSVIIPTFNEEDHLEALLEQVAWADEIIVVDSFSTDKTVAIAKQKAVRVLQREYTGPANQKNWAIPQAQHDWVLLLDADERLGPGLQEEIQAILRKGTNYEVFWIGRQNYFMGRKIRFSGWQNDAVVRFFLKDKARYNDKRVHEEIVTKGLMVGRLRNKLVHYTFKDASHFMEKMHRYSKWSAEDYLSKTPRVGFFHLWIKPFFRFLKHFIWKLGILDGKVGWVISVMMAWGVFMRYVHIMEMHRDKS